MDKLKILRPRFLVRHKNLKKLILIILMNLPVVIKELKLLEDKPINLNNFKSHLTIINQAFCNPI